MMRKQIAETLGPVERHVLMLGSFPPRRPPADGEIRPHAARRGGRGRGTGRQRRGRRVEPARHTRMARAVGGAERWSSEAVSEFFRSRL